jgi:hypothetical protein
VNRLDSRDQSHRCAHNDLRYCLVEEPQKKRSRDHLRCAIIAPPALPMMCQALLRGVESEVPAYYAIDNADTSGKRLELSGSA